MTLKYKTISAELELERGISVPEAAEINDIHPCTFVRNYAHLIKHISPRRNIVKLRDALNPQALPKTDAELLEAAERRRAHREKIESAA